MSIESKIGRIVFHTVPGKPGLIPSPNAHPRTLKSSNLKGIFNQSVAGQHPSVLKTNKNGSARGSLEKPP